MHVFLHVLYIYEHTYKYNILRKIFTIIASLEKINRLFKIDILTHTYARVNSEWTSLINGYLKYQLQGYHLTMLHHSIFGMVIHLFLLMSKDRIGKTLAKWLRFTTKGMGALS